MIEGRVTLVRGLSCKTFWPQPGRINTGVCDYANSSNCMGIMTTNKNNHVVSGVSCRSAQAVIFVVNFANVNGQVIIPP
jgi:hypothetical protein